MSPFAVRRTAANRIDVATRLNVRTTAGCRLFPLGEALPSTTSAGSCLPLFGRFLGTTTSSDFSSAYMLGVRLLPSRAGPAQVRARVRPLRFRAKNFSTHKVSDCARFSPCKPVRHGTMLPSLQRNEIGTSELARFAAQYLARSLPCERFTAALASNISCITRGVGVVGWTFPVGDLHLLFFCQIPGALRLGSSASN